MLQFGRRTAVAWIFLVASLSWADEPRDKPATPEPAKRRVYVLHSGIHTILANPEKNIAAISIREGLRSRGVDDKNIIVMENPFPTASWYNMFPVECFKMFAACMLPDSKVSQEAYLRLHKALEAKEVKAEDEIVWVGHSAGGQMGLTMCHLACNLKDHPKLAKAAQPYRFDMVICLGAPIGKCLIPAEIKLRHYYSPEDRVVHHVVSYGPTAIRLIGQKITLSVMPPAHDRCVIRIFHDVEHPYWDVDPRVLDAIIGEFNPERRPAWQTEPPVLNPGLSLMRLVAHAFEQHYQVTLEDPPRQK